MITPYYFYFERNGIQTAPITTTRVKRFPSPSKQHRIGTMIAASPFDNRNLRNAHHPHKASAASHENKIQSSLRSARSFPDQRSLFKQQISLRTLNERVMMKKQGAVTKIGLRNPPQLIYQALQQHRRRMNEMILNTAQDTSNNDDKMEYVQRLRQQLQSIELEIKKLLEPPDETIVIPTAATRDERPAAVTLMKRRNSISRSMNIAQEIQIQTAASSSTHNAQWPPIRMNNHSNTTRIRRGNTVHKPTFPVPLSIPEEEIESLWSSCPSLQYEPEPRDLPPKLPIRR